MQPNKTYEILTTDQKVSGSTPDGCATSGHGLRLTLRALRPRARHSGTSADADSRPLHVSDNYSYAHHSTAGGMTITGVDPDFFQKVIHRP